MQEVNVYRRRTSELKKWYELFRWYLSKIGIRAGT